jgi:hypothetical protein
VASNSNLSLIKAEDCRSALAALGGIATGVGDMSVINLSANQCKAMAFCGDFLDDCDTYRMSEVLSTIKWDSHSNGQWNFCGGL